MITAATKLCPKAPPRASLSRLKRESEKYGRLQWARHQSEARLDYLKDQLAEIRRTVASLLQATLDTEDEIAELQKTIPEIMQSIHSTRAAINQCRDELRGQN